MPDNRAAHRRIERRAELLMGRTWNWQDRAACAEEPVEIFFGPERETPRERAARERRAVQICAECPVIAMCRSHATQLPEPYGVWGATTEADRGVGGRRRRRVASSAA